jgi:hypothetical protein
MLDILLREMKLRPLNVGQYEASTMRPYLTAEHLHRFKISPKNVGDDRNKKHDYYRQPYSIKERIEKAFICALTCGWREFMMRFCEYDGLKPEFNTSLFYDHQKTWEKLFIPENSKVKIVSMIGAVLDNPGSEALFRSGLSMLVARSRQRQAMPHWITADCKIVEFVISDSIKEFYHIYDSDFLGDRLAFMQDAIYLATNLLFPVYVVGIKRPGEKSTSAAVVKSVDQPRLAKATVGNNIAIEKFWFCKQYNYWPEEMAEIQIDRKLDN